ncbi:MAG: class I SAM-dependent methyltransferase [Syntrophales bacterium]|nr:class I SAM-dependent methyltransferase [Syntrophales bacterium]
MTNPEDNRFEDFFSDDLYVSLKNSLYNYRLRRRAVRKCVQFHKNSRILEVGSGLSPMLGENRQVVYSDLSFYALKSLKGMQKGGIYVEADALSLPFKTGTFSMVVCSEVLEHIPDDLSALKEIERVLADEGTLVLTFPHRRAYFALDDRFVRHFRRYDLAEMDKKLQDAGLEITAIKKVLGPLEKITMMFAIFIVSEVLPVAKRGADSRHNTFLMKKVITPLFKILNILYCLPAGIDARMFPRRLASVILVRAKKLP